MSATQSEQIKELATALAAAQAEVEAAKKESTNPHFKNKYADLASVWLACRGPLTSHGLAVTQWPSTTERGVAVTTVLTHSSGQWMRDTLELPLAQNATAQQVGSAITYARRYMLAAVAGVAPDDDDGEAASKAAPKETQRKTTKPAAKEAVNGKPQPNRERSEANVQCRKIYAAYVIAASKAKQPMRELAGFLADALGKPEEDVVANEAAWNKIPDRYWDKAAIEITALTASLPRETKEREPGEDDETMPDDWSDQDLGSFVEGGA